MGNGPWGGRHSRRAAWPCQDSFCIIDTSQSFLSAERLQSCIRRVDGNYAAYHVVVPGWAGHDMAGHQAPSTSVLAHGCGLFWWHAFWVRMVFFSKEKKNKKKMGALTSHLKDRADVNLLTSWDTGLIGGVLTMGGFQHSFNLDKNSSDYANLSGNIVSVLQGGCFFGAMSSFWLSDKVLVSTPSPPFPGGGAREIYCQHNYFFADTTFKT